MPVPGNFEMDRDHLKTWFLNCINGNAHDGVEPIKLNPESVECMAEACVCVLEMHPILRMFLYRVK